MSRHKSHSKKYTTATLCSKTGKQCSDLKPPLYGKISLPCAPYYESTCTVRCMDKYFLVGPSTDTCIVAEDDKMKWKNENECRGNDSN